MGKVDDMRAMRAERWASQQKFTSSYAASARSHALDKPDEALQEPALCGHMSISKKSCTREAAHDEKNHRYQ